MDWPGLEVSHLGCRAAAPVGQGDGSASCDGYVASQGTTGPPNRARPSPPRNVNDRGGTVTPLIRHNDSSRTNEALPLAGDVTE